MPHGIRPDDPTHREVWHGSPGAESGARVSAFWDGGSAAHTVLPAQIVTAGRALECDIRIDHPSVSRAHVRIHGGPPLLVEDLGSSNGTRVGGRRLAPHAIVEVRAGEVIELGTAMVVVQTSHEGPKGASSAEGSRAAAADDESPMDRLKRLVALVSRGQLSVILLGETGVGKDVLATRIHETSSRAGGPFVKLNCAAFTETLLEGELFGYERGAFTGAVKAKAGLIESGSGGTVFLDELGEMPPTTQVKLLRVLENREVLRLGSVTPRRIDVRFVSATHRDLTALIGQGLFRQDLFFRLNGITITVPPLRQRRAEILPLAASFLADEQGRQGIPRGAGFSARARALLLGHAWPGNIRELKNVVERAVALSGGAEIEADHLMFDAATNVGNAAPAALLSQDVATFERERIRLALERAHGNQTVAAKELGISRRTLGSRLSEYDLPRPRKGQSDCG